MKILLTGGGTGGHIYPLLAIAEELNRVVDHEHFSDFKLYYMATDNPQKELFDAQFVTFIPVSAGKMRTYFSLKNGTDIFKTAFGVVGALIKVFRLYPDVIISKGGYASFPALVAARLLRIPVIVHESDTVPGRVNKWSGKFAHKVALSYPEAAEYFDQSKVSITGQPVRQTVAHVGSEGAKAYFELDETMPVIGVIGGSLGAKIINDTVVNILPELLEQYQVIHQTGKKQFEEIQTDARITLGEDTKRTRYKPYPYLSDLETKMFGGACDVIVSRAGSTIFEIAAWGKPSIIIPGRGEVFHGDHQRKNAYHYARTGACTVIEEANLTSSVLKNEIDLILEHKDRYDTMAMHAQHFFKADAAHIIATEAIKIALEHEK